jgi:hypothetical protein
LAVLLLVCCLCLTALGAVSASSGYELRADNAVDTPERNVTFEGTTLTIDHVGVFEHDGAITAAVSAPNDSHSVELRSATDPDTIIAIKDEESDGTVSFDIADNQLDPGSYVLLLYDTNYQRAVPVVVSGYDLSTDLAENETANELTISTTVTPTASSGQPHGVEAVVWNENARNRVTLSQQSGNEYQTTVSLSQFSGESYEVYLSAVGDETVYDGENEIVGVDTASSEESTESDDGGSSPSTGGTDEADEPDTNETDPDNSTVDNDTDPSADDESESVIQPNNVSDNESDTDDTSDQTNDETPLSPGLTLVALLSAALVAVRRSQ